MHAYDNEAMTSLCRHPCICPITANGVPRTHSNNPTGHNTKLSKVYMNGVNLRLKLCIVSEGGADAAERGGILAGPPNA